jgi:hypothetical protein
MNDQKNEDFGQSFNFFLRGQSVTLLSIRALIPIKPVFDWLAEFSRAEPASQPIFLEPASQ